MQEGVILKASPVPPEERISANEIQGPGDGLARPLGKNQERVLSQMLSTSEKKARVR
jgi:hypothetical protein